MTFARAFLLAVLLALVAGCALTEDSEDHDAGSAVKSLLEAEYFGNYAEAWDSLHPRHQRFVTQQEYEECRRGIDVQGTLDSVVVLDVQDAPLTVHGLPPRTPAKAVEVRVVTDASEYTADYHVVNLDGNWRWVLTDRAARGFERTDCPE